MRSVHIAELPNFDDHATKEIGLRVQKMRLTILKTVNSLFSQNAPASKAAPLIVVAAVFHRMAECSLSIELLASKGFVRDAATLLLTLIELRIDLQYIVLSPGREDEWLKHTTENRKPWTVRQQITEIFDDMNERDAEFKNYRTFSMVKHGNPAGGTTSFPIGVQKDTLLFPSIDEKPNLLPAYLFAVGATLYDACIAAGKMVHPVGFDISGEIEQLRELDVELRQLNESHLLSMMKKYMKEQGNPSL